MLAKSKRSRTLPILTTGRVCALRIDQTAIKMLLAAGEPDRGAKAPRLLWGIIYLTPPNR